MSPVKHVMVFKTETQCEKRILQLCSWLNAHPDISDCSIDLEDCDNVLRLVGTQVRAASVIRLARAAEVECELLAMEDWED